MAKQPPRKQAANKRQVAVVILAAGQGTRMKSTLPKVLHPVAGQAMVRHVLDAAAALKPDRIVVVTGKGQERVAAAVAPARIAIQHPARGTGHAVMAALPALKGFKGDVIVLFGDSPLLTPALMKDLLAARRAKSDPAAVIVGFRPLDPAAYGRLIVDGKGALQKIVEFKNATADERAVRLCNAGLMAFDGARLPALLKKLSDRNAQGEYLLTDTVEHANAKGWTCRVVEADPVEVMGINTRAELSVAEAAMQQRLRRAAMAAGVTMTAPETVYLRSDTTFGRDVTIEPFVVFGPKVSVGNDVVIRSHSHIEGATIGAGATIGPFARLRPGAKIAEDAHIGNFVEIKNASVERGAKVNHLTYIGDARIGATANIGAGTITCNYDGFDKHHTDIGAGAFIGSNSALVAPVKIGAGAIVAAGSVITRDVPADALSLGRGRQEDKPGLAAKFRTIKSAQKARKKT
ncbi:MAG: bifunctional UDP-N-acetylglucosamine diphosphorylase/glucosamine-1-phosphate N-acetyltransferase GlmU [Ferrovibrio sp.]|uniref:bifunctional UDP-N-acetylglucosamine diphosphorylase/glucosamine-1-phosphate N-acetyltransferase GlmU n=1 Tax=Ferrovibrio sp. TaxID=1917215 RepID=UPI00262A6E99|nr:bifunctional UDP-N-acetylglucosamine diphosphorylase/glucosamine-1-phosphate N-acetyltransferase GlmU [Ferrovibrio sp.]MCW0232621.1 bifunctional UDP-N-acetylglucosamine diphosphorylase/glucosamine-1-phosphate N-acetyltransferase GlmU [Ferrovibrio sp.]